jgi:UPF0716 protein FxsA
VLALLVALIVVPVVELAVMVQVASMIGVLPTVALVLASCVAGAWLMKVEGLGVLRRMQTQVAEGQVPTNEVVDGVLILVGGLLMVLPGFVTGVLGLLLLVPPVRALLRPVVIARAARRAERGRARFAAYAGTVTFGAPTGASSFDPTWVPPRPPFAGPVYDVDGRLRDASTEPPTPSPDRGSSRPELES